MSKEETRRVLSAMGGTTQLMAKLLYGSGIRLMECIRLRVKDIDFEINEIRVHSGKGDSKLKHIVKHIGLGLHSSFKIKFCQEWRPDLGGKPRGIYTHHLQAGKRAFVNATFSSNLANVTAARPCLLEGMRLL